MTEVELALRAWLDEPDIQNELRLRKAARAYFGVKQDNKQGAQMGRFVEWHTTSVTIWYDRILFALLHAIRCRRRGEVVTSESGQTYWHCMRCGAQSR